MVGSEWRATPAEWAVVMTEAGADVVEPGLLVRRCPMGGGERESACKPGSVEDSHSSGIAVTGELKRPTRKHAGLTLPLAWRLSYLALLQVGFAMPSVLPRPRCALTAPFHPCQRHFWCFGGLLSVALSVGSRRPGVTWHLVHGSPDFPPHFVRNAATVRPTPARTISTCEDALKEKPVQGRGSPLESSNARA